MYSCTTSAGLCSTAVVKTFRLFGIDARVPGNGVGNVLKYINRGISKWPCLGKIAYEHTDAEVSSSVMVVIACFPTA